MSRISPAAHMPFVVSLLRQAGLPHTGACSFSSLESHLLPCRAAARLPDKPRAVLVTLFPYRFDRDDPHRNLSRYACVPDYHETAGQVLKAGALALAEAFPAARFEPFLDNSPLPEVRAAALAGLGCIGDNGLLIHPRFGSYVFIGAIVTDLPLSVTETVPAACLHCGACRRYCPGGCLTGRFERTLCVSHISQKKGSLTAQEEDKLRKGGLLWGCDVCQEVCPLNRTACCEPHPCFSSYTPVVQRKDLFQTEGKAYGWRGSGPLLRNWDVLFGRS